jgi:pseudouridine kinase
MARDATICVIGAANVDLAGQARGPLISEESNPGGLHVSWGGVGRNIAENLARLGQPVQLITVLGDDDFGKQLARDATACGIDLKAQIIPAGTTPSYLAINRANGELEVAVAAMDLLDHLTIEWIEKHAPCIRDAGLCVLDTNLGQTLIGAVLDRFPEQVFCVDAVSVAKANRLSPWINRFNIIKLNRAEAESLSDTEIEGRDGMQVAARFFMDLGVEQVFISLGDDGLFYADSEHSGWLRSDHQQGIASINGAGDAMLAAIALSWLRHQGSEEAAFRAMACAMLTLRHRAAVNPALNEEAVLKAKEQIRHG